LVLKFICVDKGKKPNAKDSKCIYDLIHMKDKEEANIEIKW
jgi:hypothetical protein